MFLERIRTSGGEGRSVVKMAKGKPSPSQSQLKLLLCISIQSVIAKTFMFECLQAVYTACTCISHVFVLRDSIFNVAMQKI